MSPLNPHAIRDSARILGEDSIRCSVDIGKVNDRFFLMWAGVGFDAQVLREVDERPDVKRRLGMLAFLGPAVAQSLQLQATRAQISVDGKKLNRRMLLLVASNIQLYGAIVRIAPLANIHDGFLDVRIFSGYSALSAYAHLFRLLTGADPGNPEMMYRQAEEISVSCRKPLPVHADGEIVGDTPVQIRSVPGALQVLLPRTYHMHGGLAVTPAA